MRVTAEEVTTAAGMIGGDLGALGGELLRAACAQQAREMSQRGGLVSIEVVAEAVRGNIATVTTLTTYGDGTTSERDSELTRLDGAWKITPGLE